MIYPDDYKCLTCKFRYYACKYRQNSGMLACSYYTYKANGPHKVANMALLRCFFGVCARIISLKNQEYGTN